MNNNKLIIPSTISLLQFDKFQLKNIRSNLVKFFITPIQIIINIYNVNSIITISYKNKVYYTKSTGVLGFTNRERRFYFAINILLKDSVSNLVLLCRKFKCGKVDIHIKQQVSDFSIIYSKLLNSFSFYLNKWSQSKFLSKYFYKNKLLFLLHLFLLYKYNKNKLIKKKYNNKLRLISRIPKKNRKNERYRILFIKRKIKKNKMMKLKLKNIFPIRINKILMYINTSFGEGIKCIKRQDLQYWL